MFIKEKKDKGVHLVVLCSISLHPDFLIFNQINVDLMSIKTSFKNIYISYYRLFNCSIGKCVCNVIHQIKFALVVSLRVLH